MLSRIEGKSEVSMRFRRLACIIYPTRLKLGKVRINKTVNKRCRLPPQSFKINLKNIFLHIFLDSWRLDICRIFVEFPLKPVYPTITFMVFGLLENAFASQKFESRYFYSCIQVLIITPQVEVNHSPRQCFFENLPPAEREGEEKTMNRPVVLSNRHFISTIQTY